VKDIKGSVPSPRYGHCCAVNADGSSMFLFGGYNKVSSFNDIFEFEFGLFPASLSLSDRLFTFPPFPRQYQIQESKTWKKWRVKGTAPSGTFYGSAIFHGQKLLTFAGRDLQSQYYDELKLCKLLSALSVLF